MSSTYYYTGPEKVQVFVSSTINECEEERKQAHQTIESLNHSPLLFESSGAKPYPPRNHYLGLVNKAHIFVAIYKDSYGWIAPDMEISGIEDEFHIATSRGMPRLIYVKTDDSNRTEELKVFLEKVMLKSGVTVAFYNETNELHERLRDDIEAEVARTFHDRQQLETSLSTDARSVLNAIIPSSSEYVDRPDLIQSISSAITDAGLVQVVGPAGIGKTVLLAQLAEKRRSIYVAATYLSRKDLAALIATSIRNNDDLPQQSYIDYHSAYRDLINLWEGAPRIDLVIDDCRDMKFIEQLRSDLKSITPTKSLVFSSRFALELAGQETVTVPPMSPDQIAQLASHIDSEKLDQKSIEKIHQHTRGNPLEARFYTSVGDGKVSVLDNFEGTYWHSFDTQSKEILTYIAISPIPLEVDGLLELISAQSSHSLFSIIERIKPFLKDEVLGYSIIHESIKDAILRISKASAHRHAYYSKSLSSLFVDKNDTINGYLVLNTADEDAALELAPRAAFESIRHGNVDIALNILHQKLSSEKKANKEEDALITFLGIIELSVQSGPVEDAMRDAAEAVKWAESIADQSLILMAREIQATTQARGTLQPRALEELYELRKIHEDNGDLWTRGRIDLEIGAIFINMKRLEEAESATRNALASFKEVDDKYGCSLAKRNLISALSGLRPDDDDEVAELLSDFQTSTTTEDNDRNRAWFCNIMVRKRRRSGDLRSAEKHGREAIEIGEKLGDKHLVALNQVCLGNVYRDKEDYDKAYTEYFLASKVAEDIGDRALEASTSNLIANLHNRMSNYDLAIHYANHAVSLVQGSLATTELSDSLEELADAFLSNEQNIDAAKAYIDAALAILDANRPDEIARLASHGLFIFVKEGEIDSYMSTVDQLWQISHSEEQPDTRHDKLYNEFLTILTVLPRSRIIDILGLHFRLFFEDLSYPESRYLFSIISRDIVTRKSPKNPWRLLFPILPLLTSATKGSIGNLEIVTLADSLHKHIDGISFKPREDGSAHWTVELSGKSPVALTISQIDNQIDTSICAMILALFLKGFEEDIQHQFATDQGFFCQEIPIQICSASVLEDDMGDYVRPALEKAPCTVSRLTDASDLDAPTVVFCREDIAETWASGTGRGSSMQFLIGLTLTEIAYRLLGGEVEIDSLRPKVLNIVRQTIS